MTILLADIVPANQLWHAVPLVAAVSLVYGATRHELMVPILHNAIRAAIWIVSFMAAIFFLLMFVSWIL